MARSTMASKSRRPPHRQISSLTATVCNQPGFCNNNSRQCARVATREPGGSRAPQLWRYNGPPATDALRRSLATGQFDQAHGGLIAGRVAAPVVLTGPSSTTSSSRQIHAAGTAAGTARPATSSWWRERPSSRPASASNTPALRLATRRFARSVGGAAQRLNARAQSVHQPPATHRCCGQSGPTPARQKSAAAPALTSKRTPEEARAVLPRPPTNFTLQRRHGASAATGWANVN